MYVSNAAKYTPDEVNIFDRENGCFVTQRNGFHVSQAPGWSCSCSTFCGVEQGISHGNLLLSSTVQNESTKQTQFLGDFHKNLLDDSENAAGTGLWIPGGMAALDFQSDRVPDEVHSMRSETTPVQLHSGKKKNEVAGRKYRRSKPINKEVMELYRISCPSGSKDRHSKVATARGPRDRRMRLSVDTAIKFFHLQDRLGFDQPSKAVEWLIEKCRPAIDQLPRISQSELLTDPHSDRSRVESLMNPEENVVVAAAASSSSAHRKRNRSSKLTTCLHDPTHPPTVKQLKTKAKDRAQEATKCTSYGRGGKAKQNPNPNSNPNPAETMNLEDNTASWGYKLNLGLEAIGRRLLNMHGHDFTSNFGGMQNTEINPYLKNGQFSPDIPIRSYPFQVQSGSTAQLQSAESFSQPNSTAFSVPSYPFPQVMPSITIGPQSTTRKF